MHSSLRSLARTPGFTLIAVLTLALGIGMNTAMFSMLNGFLLRPLAYPQADRLFVLDRNTPQQPHDLISPPDLADIAPAASGVAELAGWRFWGFTLSDGVQPPDMPNALRVTPNFFSVLGVEPTLGRTFLPEEDAPGKNNVIVVSHSYWQRHFGGAPDVVGRTVKLDGVATQIVGVMGPDEDLPRFIADVGFFRPIALSDQERRDRNDHSLAVFGRYREGITPAQAGAQFAVIGQRLAHDHPTETAGATLGVHSLQSETFSGTGYNMTMVLIGLSGLVLLIACANLANLLLARAIARAREFSIRAALGASRLQLIKPLVAECLVLAALGTASAMFVSSWTTRWLAARFTATGSKVDFSPDVRVFAFAIVVSAVTTLLFGVAPAWWAARAKINDSLKSSTRGGTASRSQVRFRQLLIVAQFALALVLLAGAGMFLTGLRRFVGASVGWDPAHVVTGVVNLASPTRYGRAEPILAFHAQLRDRLLALPGVENAAVGYDVPLFNPPSRHNFLVEGRPAPAPGQDISAWVNGVSASFLDTTGLHLLSGRFIDETDQATSHPVVVINETMARTLFPGADAVGHRVAVAGYHLVWAEIVGVVGDVRPMNMRPSPVRFQVYKPFPEEAWQYVAIAIRVADPAKAPALLDPIRRAVASLDADTPVTQLIPVPQRIGMNFAIWDTINQLLMLFATLGLLLAALGIYGVVTRLVTQRTGEIGIRLALGAQVRDILRLVLGSGLRMATLGAAVGMIGAWLLSRLIASALPALATDSSLPVAAAGILLVIVALLACWLPARRATKVNPSEALRAE